MTQQLARIAIHTHELPMHKYYYTYEWLGKPWWPVAIACHPELGVEIDYKTKKVTGPLPWRLLVIDYRPERHWYICRRSDIPWLFPAIFDWLRLTVFNGWRSFSARFALTMKIWGLSE